MTVRVHPIEAESYRLLSERCDLSAFAPGPRAVVERVLHATVDFSFVDSLVVPPEAVEVGVAAIRAGAPIVVDVEMVRAGISGLEVECYLAEARAERSTFRSEQAASRGERAAAATLSARAMELAASAHRSGAIFVVGCAPTALERLVAWIQAGDVMPALVVGVPVGLVGAAEAKEHLRSASGQGSEPGSGGPFAAISNVGERGGSAVAAAIVNALARMASA